MITQKNSLATDHFSTFPWVLFLSLVGLFYISGHVFSMSIEIDPETSRETMMMDAARGSVVRQIGFSLLGLYGAIVLIFSRRDRLRIDGPIGWLLLVFCGWMVLSVLWSADPGLTLRRTVVITMFLIGGLGCSRRIRGRNIARFVLFSCLFYVGIGLVAELVLGTFQPNVPEYRFAGTLHPNWQGMNCALVVLSAYFLGRGSVNYKMYRVCMFVGFVFLMLTKSRTSFWSTVMVISTHYILTTTASRRIRSIYFGMLILLLIALLLGETLFPALEDVFLFGRGTAEGEMKLAGRLPLFEECFEYFLRRPILGYGYGAFWTPNRIEDITESQGWVTAGSHSIYIDSALDLGVIGFIVFGVLIWKSIRKSWFLSRNDQAHVYDFYFGFMIFLLLNGLMESIFLASAFPLFVAFLVFISLGFRFQKIPSKRAKMIETVQGADPYWRSP